MLLKETSVEVYFANVCGKQPQAMNSGHPLSFPARCLTKPVYLNLKFSNSMRKPVLVIIYNHQFKQNISRIEDLYSKRFSNIFHLVPFYDGTKRNVISVYENSFYFQGYIAQGWQMLKSIDYDDFIFIGDDLLLNPCINEFNYHEYLGVDVETAFIPNLIEFHHLKDFWWRCRDAVVWPESHQMAGLEVAGMLPSANEAIEHYARHGLTPAPIPAFLVNPSLKAEQPDGQQLVPLRYPLIGSYSDIIVVPRNIMNKFVLYCGIFAATRLFVEVAIPSALAMAAPRLISEERLALRGRALWTPEEMEILKPFNQSLSVLLDNFPEQHLYLHPIKLSKWKN